MSTPVKTVATSLLTLQAIASNAVVISGVQSVTTKFSAQVGVHLGRDDTGGVLAVGVAFRIEGSMKSSGDDQWFPLAEYTSGTATPLTGTISGTEAAGSTTIESTSTGGMTLANSPIILFKNGTITNSEWSRVKSVTNNTNVVLIDGITNAQTGSVMYSQAEFWSPVIDLLNITRVRLVVDASGTGRSIVVEAYMNTCDSIG